MRTPFKGLQLAAVLAMSVALSGCWLTGTVGVAGVGVGNTAIIAASSDPNVVAVVNKVNTAINKGSTKIAAYCSYLPIAKAAYAIAVQQNNSKAILTVNAAVTLLTNFCANPPKDLTSVEPLMLQAISDAVSIGWIKP